MVGLLASVQVLVLSTIFSKELLISPSFPPLLQPSSTRLAEAYSTLITFFKSSGIGYFPCHSTVFVLARLASKAQLWEDEVVAFRRYLQAGVLVVLVGAYHISDSQKGWMQVPFAIDWTRLGEGTKRIETCLKI
jgi:hypothetical protein